MDANNPIDFNQSQELNSLKKNFSDWRSFLRGKTNLSLEEALATLNQYSITIPRLVMPNANVALKFYRARIISSESAEDISDPRAFSYPPAKFAATFQRANAPGFPVFYGAMDGKTALEELRQNGDTPIQKGDKVYLSEWRIKPGVTHNFCYLTTPEIIHEGQLFAPITKNVFKQLPEIFKTEDQHFGTIQQFLYEEIGKLFLTGQHIQTGTIAHEILYHTPLVNGLKINGLMYPSCANGYRSINCALLPEFVDQHLQLEIVRKLSFNEFVEEGAHSTVHYVGECDREKIIWKSFASNVNLEQHTSEVALEINWPLEMTQAATFYLHGKEIDFRAYCLEKLNKVNLNALEIPLESHNVFKDSGIYYLRYEETYEEGIAYLKFEEERNPVTVLRITTPCHGILMEADKEAVAALK